MFTNIIILVMVMAPFFFGFVGVRAGTGFNTLFVPVASAAAIFGTVHLWTAEGSDIGCLAGALFLFFIGFVAMYAHSEFDMH